MTETLGQLWINLGVKSTVGKDLSSVKSELSSVNSVAGSSNSVMSSVGSGLKTVGTAAVVAGSAVGVGLVAGGVKALGMFNDFEKSVSNAASVTGLAGDAFNAAKANISAVAQELGQKTAFSSSQAADALYDLASAGVDVSKITSGQMVPVLNLASGTQYDLAETTAAVTSTLSQFGLGFESAGRVADVFAKDAGLTQASMDKLSLSMNYVGTISNTCGISLENTSAALGVLYNAGMDGSTAGTSLRGVIASLVSPSDKAVGVFKSMGLTIDDVNPKTHNFNDIIQTLADKGLNATQAFDLFGRESAPAILALTSKTGDLKELTTQLQNAGGAAQQMADQQLDTLAGSWDSFTGSLENVWINIGQALAPTARAVLDSLNSMVPAVQDVVIGMVNGFVDLVTKLSPVGNSIIDIIQTIYDSITNIFSSGGAGLGNGLIMSINNIFQSIASSVRSAMPTVESVISSIINFFVTLVSNLSPVYNNIQSIVNNIVNVFRAFFTGISTSATSSNAATTIAKILDTITLAFSMFSDVVAWALVSIAPTIKNVFSGIVTTIQGLLPTFETIWDAMASVFELLPFIIEGAVAKLAPVGTKIKEVFSKIADAIRNIDWQGIFSKVQSAFTFGYNAIKTGDWSGLFNGIKTAFTNGVNSVKNIDWQGIGSKIKTVFDDIKNKIISADWAGTFEKVKAAFNAGKDKILNIVWDAIPDKIKGIFENVKSAISEVVTALQPTWDNLKSSFESVKEIIEIFRPSFESLAQTLSDNKGAAGATAFSIAITAVKLAIGLLIGGLNLITGVLSTVLKFFAEHPTVTKFAATLLVAAAGVTALGAAVTAITGFFAPVIAGILSIGTTLATVGAGATLAVMFPGLAGIWAAFTAGLGIITGVVGGIISVIGTVASVAIPVLSAAFGVLSTAMGIVTYTVIPILVETLGLLVTPVGLIIASLTLLYVAWSQNWGNIQGVTASVVAGIQNYWNQFTAELGRLPGAASQAFSTLKTVFSNAFNGIITSVQTWVTSQQVKYSQAITQLTTLKTQIALKWSEIKQAIATKANEIIATLQTWYTGIQTKFTQVKTAIQGLITDWTAKWNSLKTTASSLATQIVSVLQTWYSNIQAKFNSVKTACASILTAWRTHWTNFKTTLSTAASNIVSVLQTMYSNIQAKFNSIKTAASTMLNNWKTHWNNVKSATSTAVSNVTSALATMYSNIQSKFSSIKTAASNMLSTWKTHWTNMVSAVKNTISSISSAIQSIVNSVKNKASDFKSAGQSLIQGLIDGIEDKISGVKSAMNKVMSAADKFTTHSPAKEGPFRKLPTFDPVITDPLEAAINKTERTVLPHLVSLMGGIQNTMSSTPALVLSDLNAQIAPSSMVTAATTRNSTQTKNITNNTVTNYNQTTIKTPGTTTSMIAAIKRATGN